MLGTVLALMTAAAAGFIGPVDAAASTCAETAAACSDEASDSVPFVNVVIDDAALERCTTPAPPPESRDQGCPDASFMVSRTADGERAPLRLKPTPAQRNTASLPGLSSGRPAPRPENVAPAPAQPFALYALPALDRPEGRPFAAPPLDVMTVDTSSRLDRPPRAG